MTHSRGRSIEPELIVLLEERLGEDVVGLEELGGGWEARVFRVERESGGAFVLHLAPRWRTLEELRWVVELTRVAARAVPEVVAPLDLAPDAVLEWKGRGLTLFPFVEGEPLNREDPGARKEAARMLARLHAALLGWTVRPRPPSRPDRPRPPPDPPGLRDPALDRWWRERRARGLTEGATHGDYYRGNVLARGTGITGVIDWFDATVRPLLVELAGATFEFCRDEAHRLHGDRARAFIAAYREAGGPVPESEISLLGPVMRTWVRDDARNALAASGGVETDYVRKQMAAFRALGQSARALLEG